MRRRERDPGREDVAVLGGLVGARPVRRPPLLVRLRGVVGVDAHELVGHEQPVGDVGAGAVEGLQPDAGERRQQHREVELLLALGAVERLVEHAVGLDLVDVGAGDPVDPALGEQRGVEDAARGDVAAPLKVHAAHAEVAELVLVRDPGDLGAVAHAAVSQLELEVDDVLERGALAGAGAVTDADQEAARSPRRIRSTSSSSAAAACAAWPGGQTDRLLPPSGPRPSVLSKRSAGPVALIRKS